jgi:hypothetical protein
VKAAATAAAQDSRQNDILLSKAIIGKFSSAEAAQRLPWPVLLENDDSNLQASPKHRDSPAILRLWRIRSLTRAGTCLTRATFVCRGCPVTPAAA